MRLLPALIISAGLVSASLIARPVFQQLAEQAEPSPTVTIVPVRHDPVVREASPGDLEVCLAMARRVDDELANRLQEVSERDPAAFRMAVDRICPQLLDLERLAQRDDGLYALKVQELQNELELLRQATALRQAVAAGDDVRAARLEANLRTAIQLDIALKIKLRFDFLCSLQEEIDAIKSRWDDLGENFNTIVEERLNELKEPITP